MTQTPRRGEVEDLRTEIARVIEPEAWNNFDGYSVATIHADAALAKADAILSIIRARAALQPQQVTK